MFSAISIFNEALNQLHKICLWCFKYRLVWLKKKKKKSKWKKITDDLICHPSHQIFNIWTKYFNLKTTYFFNARGSDPTEVGLDSLEVFRMLWTQQLKSCLVGQFLILASMSHLEVFVMLSPYMKHSTFYSFKSGTPTLALKPRESSLPSRLLINSGTKSVTMDTNSSSFP